MLMFVALSVSRAQKLTAAPISTGTVQGTITDSLLGTPIDSAAVSLVYNEYDTLFKKYNESVVNKVYTDSLGNYSFTGITIITTTPLHPSYYSIISTDTNYDTTTNNTVGVSRFAVAIVNLKMLPKLNEITGTVTDSLVKTPIAHVQVVLWYDYGGPGTHVQYPLDTVFTNNEGSYTVTNIAFGGPYGQIFLSLSAQNYDTCKSPLFGASQVPVPATLYVINVSLLSKGGAIVGKVTSMSNAGIAGAKVVLLKYYDCGLPACPKTTPQRIDSAITDNKGAYAFANVAEINNSKPGTGGYYYQLAITAANYNSKDTLAIVAGKTITTEDIMLTPIATGIVRDAHAQAASFGIHSPVKIRVFDLSGRLVYNGVNNGLDQIIIPSKLFVKGKILIAELSGLQGIIRKTVVVR